MDFVEHLLVVLTLLAAAAINGWLGFLGIVVGAYRMNTLVTFSSVYQMKKREFWAAHRSGDVSTLVAALVFVHIGFVLLLLITFGPKGQEKSTQSNIRIR